MSLDEKLELLTDIATDARRCKKHLLKATLHEYHLVQNLTRFYDIAREHESELDRIGAADNEKKVRMEEKKRRIESSATDTVTADASTACSNNSSGTIAPPQAPVATAKTKVDAALPAAK